MINQYEFHARISATGVEADLVLYDASLDIAHSVCDVLGDALILVIPALSPVVVTSGAFGGRTV